MAKSKFEEALATYQSALVVLEQSQPEVDSTTALDLLKARDNIACLISDDRPDPPATLLAIIDLDNRLRKLAGSIVASVKLADWRASFRPPAEAWWWSLDVIACSPTGGRFDWLWSALAVALLTISLSFLLDISTRFLSGGPDTWATFAVVGQSVLAMLVAGGTLTSLGREFFDRALKAINVSARWRQGVRLAFAALLLLALLVLRSYLPEIAVLYNNRGLTSYLNGQYTSAEFDFRRALKLSPDYVVPHYNLGLLFEDLHDYGQAKTEYRIAVAGKLDAAYNNLARLYILEEKYAEAVPLLLTGLDLAQDKEVLYDLRKNLGWARMEQTRYAEAEAQLRAAIDLAGSKASAHCLLAQVLEGQENMNGALVEWENCLKYANERNPDEDVWIEMARERLTGDGQ